MWQADVKAMNSYIDASSRPYMHDNSAVSNLRGVV